MNIRSKAGSHSRVREPVPVNPADVTLMSARGSPQRGGGPAGHYWHIYVNGVRVGYVFINLVEDRYIGSHASIQIHLNQNQRGRKIGRVAYRLACEQSKYDEVYAHMRKSNIASRRAAEAAGFTALKDTSDPQLSMIWKRSESPSQ